MKLSETMQEALDKLKEHGALERMPGGFWTYRDCPVKISHPLGGQVPSWYAGTRTIEALVDRGVAKWGKALMGGNLPVEVHPIQ